MPKPVDKLSPKIWDNALSLTIAISVHSICTALKLCKKPSNPNKWVRLLNSLVQADCADPTMGPEVYIKGPDWEELYEWINREVSHQPKLFHSTAPTPIQTPFTRGKFCFGFPRRGKTS